MKKNNLLVGILYVLSGALCLIIALMFDTKLDSLLFGFSGGFIMPGVVMIGKYFYWTSPKNRDRYAQRLENKRIELQDERKEKLRDKSGRYAYLIGLVVISFSIVLLSILEELNIIISARMLILFLGGFLIFQFISGVIIFRHLNKKY